MEITSGQRWIIHPLKSARLYFIVGTIAAYCLLCIYDGFVWSTQLAPTYGLLIIRLFVVAVLAFVDLVAIPFRHFWFVVFMLQNTAILFIPIGLIAGLTTSPSQDPAYRDKIGGFLWLTFLLAMTVFVFAYSIDLFSEDDFIYNVFVSDYLQLYPQAFSVIFLEVTLLIWALRNIFATNAFDFEESARNREILQKQKEKEKQKESEENLNEDTI